MAAVPSIGRARADTLPPEAEATRALYERYANQIFGYCVHQLGSREEAEDAVQSTFLNAFRGLRRGIVPEQESAWLFKIAHNVCLSRRRSSWRRGRIESPADFEVVEELAPAPSRRADELIGLQDVLESMPENQRRAILLREWQGLSYREIAEELTLSQAAVETLIFRARRALAQGLEQPPAEQRSRGRRVRAGTNLGGLFTALKSLFAGGAAVKAVGVAAVVAVSSVAATKPLYHGPARHAHHPQTHQRVVPPAPAASAPSQARVLRADVPAAPRSPAPVATVKRPARHHHRAVAASSAHARAATLPAEPQQQAPAATEPAPQPAPAQPTPAPEAPAPPPAAHAPPAPSPAPAKASPAPPKQSPPAGRSDGTSNGAAATKGSGAKDKGTQQGNGDKGGGGNDKAHGKPKKGGDPAGKGAQPAASVTPSAPVATPAPPVSVAPAQVPPVQAGRTGDGGDEDNPHRAAPSDVTPASAAPPASAPQLNGNSQVSAAGQPSPGNGNGNGNGNDNGNGHK